jgi:hypothetical protein
MPWSNIWVCNTKPCDSSLLHVFILQLRTILSECLVTAPILCLPEALQEEVIHWVFRNEDRLGLEGGEGGGRGGREGGRRRETEPKSPFAEIKYRLPICDYGCGTNVSSINTLSISVEYCELIF